MVAQTQNTFSLV